MKKQWIGLAMVFASAAGFGSMGIFAKYAYGDGFNVSTILSIRFILAALLFWGVAAAKNIDCRVNLRQFLLLYGMGIGGYAVMASLLFNSYHSISPSLTGIIFYTYPLLVSVVAYFVEKEPLTVRKIATFIVAMFGLILVLKDSMAVSRIIGIFLALGGAIVYSCFIVISNRMLKSISPLVSSTYICTSAAIALTLLGLGTGQIHIQSGIAGWGAIVAITLCSTFVAILAFFEGVRRIGPSKASMISMVEPLITIMLSAVCFGERLAPIQWFGTAIILCSLFLFSQKGAAESKGLHERDTTAA